MNTVRRLLASLMITDALNLKTLVQTSIGKVIPPLPRLSVRTRPRRHTGNEFALLCFPMIYAHWVISLDFNPTDPTVGEFARDDDVQFRSNMNFSSTSSLRSVVSIYSKCS